MSKSIRKAVTAVFLAISLLAAAMAGLTLTVSAVSPGAGWSDFAREGDWTYSVYIADNYVETRIWEYHGSGGNIVIPETLGGHIVTSANRGAFESYDETVGLVKTIATSLTIPSGMNGVYGIGEIIGLTEIHVATANPLFSSVDGVVFNKDKTTVVYYPDCRSGVYTIPSGTMEIDVWAFTDCLYLTGVNIPASVVKINYDSFYDCPLLSRVEILGSPEFYGVYPGDGDYYDEVFINCAENLTLIGYSGSSVKTFAEAHDIAFEPLSGGDTDPTYALTVNSGTGGGSYTAGTAVPITANAAPSGKVFDKWTGGNSGTFANVNSASTTFTMPGVAATITATYKNATATDGDILTDTATDIKVQGAPESTTLSAIAVTAGANFPLANTALKSTADKFTLFDINLLKDGIAVQPNGKVTVSIPVPQGYNGADCKIYRIETDGTKTDMNAKLENGFLVFETDHFSLYAVAQINEGNGNPKTGDNSTPILYVTLMLVSCGVLFALSIKGRKKTAGK